MNKEDLVTAVLEALGTDSSRSQAEAAIRAILDGISRSLQGNEPVQLTGFGTFAVTERKARTGRNPRTGEPIEIPAKKAVVFRPGKQLRESL